MKLLEISDFENTEFSNVGEQRMHWWKKQSAICNEIGIYLQRLGRRYPDWWQAEGKMQYQDDPTKEWASNSSKNFGPAGVSRWLLPKLGSNIKTQEIRDTFTSKYNAMLKAKQEYESLGGKYPDNK